MIISTEKNFDTHILDGIAHSSEYWLVPGSGNN